VGICSRIADRRLSVFVIESARLIVAAGRAGKRTGWGAYFSDGNGQLPALGARYDGNLLRLDNGCQVVGHDQQQAAEMADNHPKRSRNPNQLAKAILQALKFRMTIRIIKHEAVPQTGSFEVRFSDGRPSVYFYFEDNPDRRVRPDQADRKSALEAAKTFARSERNKIK